jgi:hypothetical protein
MAARLVERGYTQGEIAQMIEARHVKCHHSQISRLLSGKSGLSYAVGDALRRVYMEKCESSKEAAQ